MAVAVAASGIIIFVSGGTLGPAGAAFSTLAVVCAQVGVWLSRRSPNWGALLQGVLCVGLPLLLAHALFAPISPILVLLASALALASASPRLWRDLGHGGLIALLLITRQPVGAFLLALVWLPQAFLGELRGRLAWQCTAIALAVLTLG